jgi:spoIIIJ-associated protein
MEWVETTGKTLDEAKEKALDQLGVHQEDAEFDIIEEPKAGLFGRVRGEARVRARVKPAQVRQKVDRRDRKRTDKADRPEKAPKADGSTTDKAEKASAGGRTRQPREPKPAGDRTSKAAAPKSTAKAGTPKVAASKADTPKSSTPKSSEEQAVDARQVGEEATRFMTGLIEAFGYEGAVELVEDGDDLEVRVQGQELGLLVGPRGTTLQAVQDLARVASQRRLGDHDTRLRIDIGGYRERRRQALGQFAQQMATEVKASGVARVLEPMSSADRKVIHDTLAEVDGVATRSEGDDPHRRVIIAPAND